MCCNRGDYLHLSPKSSFRSTSPARVHLHLCWMPHRKPQRFGANEWAKRARSMIKCIKPLLYVLLCVFGAASRALGAEILPPVASIGVDQLRSLVQEWRADAAVMFYAPWCKGCKQLRPLWDDIGRSYARKENNKILFGRFDCEESAAHSRACSELKIDRYPVFAFIGYGNMRQGNGRVALFEGPLVAEYIREWVHMLSYLSYFQRLFNVTVRTSIWPFGLDKLWRRDSSDSGSSAPGSTRSVYASLASSASTSGGADHGDPAFQGQQYDWDEGGDYAEEEDEEDIDLSQLRNYGNVFKMLHDSEPSASNLALRYCVGAVTKEYCVFTQGKREAGGSLDNYCRIIDQCNSQEMQPVVCRPEACPLDQAGCALASLCLLPEVVEPYQYIGEV